MEQLELVPYLRYEKEATGILWTELDRREKLNAAVGGSERTSTLAEVGEYLRAGGDDTDALGEDRFADGGWRGRRRWGRWRAVLARSGRLGEDRLAVAAGRSPLGGAREQYGRVVGTGRERGQVTRPKGWEAKGVELMAICSR